MLIKKETTQISAADSTRIITKINCYRKKKSKKQDIDFTKIYIHRKLFIENSKTEKNIKTNQDYRGG